MNAARAIKIKATAIVIISSVVIVISLFPPFFNLYILT